MRRFGRRERARVVARVQALLAEHEPTATEDAAAGRPRVGAPDPWGAARYHESGPLLWVSDDEPVSGEPVAARAIDDERAGAGGAHAARRVRPSRRFNPGRPAALAIGAAALVAAVVAGGWVLAGKPHAVALAGPSGAALSAVSGSPLGSSAAASSASAPGCASTSGVLVVDVAGKVARPGVYRLPTGSRVVDAVQAAGGALPGVSLASLDLAAPLSDGAQIAVGVPSAAGAGPVVPGASGSPGASGAPVNLNTATLEQLETLPGIGPVLGQQILDWRTQHGGFSAVDQLKEVSGIGDARFAELQPLVTL